MNQNMNKVSFRNLIKTVVLSVDNDWAAALIIKPVDNALDFSSATFMKWLEINCWPLQDCCVEYMERNPSARVNDSDMALVLMNRLKETIDKGYAKILYECREVPVTTDECVDVFTDYCFAVNLSDSIYQNIIAHMSEAISQKAS